MSKNTVLCLCRSEAIRFAAQYLSALGLAVTESPGPAVRHLLLPVPSGGTLEELEQLLPRLPEGITISGGNLDVLLLHERKTVDFLQDPYYLADNAAITARCALEILETRLDSDLENCPVLVLGWGRIGKCLARLLRDKGADVTVAARRDTDLAMLHALGFHSVPVSQAGETLPHCRVVVNTVPAMVLPDMDRFPDCLALELASLPGMAGGNILSARGLPGKMAPAASGKLIAETFIRLSLNKEEQS